ncbi:MAG: ATP-binding cassette domain-containing protein [Micrococcaceae bacterium]
MLSVKDLTKNYGKHLAVDQLNFKVNKGEIFAFLGVNGTGKSTTISCITTTLGFDSGSITLDDLKVGKDNDKIRNRIGVVFQDSLLDPILSCKENIALRASFYDIKDVKSRITKLAEMLDITEFIDQRYGTLSGGQRRRVDIARALIHEPKMLFLDEPTTGLDPQSRKQLWSTIDELRKTGLTVLFSTHYMEETENADRVLIINDGKTVAEDTPSELRAKHSKTRLKIKATNPQKLSQAVTKAKFAEEGSDEMQTIIVPDSKAALDFLNTNTNNIEDFELRHGNMDDVFLNLTGRKG